jgi:alpha-1,2-mannosyltransferase
MAATVWTVLLIDLSGPGVRDRLGKIKGTDFLQFYAMGASIYDGDAERLYDFRAQDARIQAIAPDSKDTLFIPIQSPQTGLALAPLGAFPYTVAFAIWAGIIVLLYSGACYLMWRDCTALHQHWRAVLGSCAAFPGVYIAVLHGQMSAVCVVLVAIALAALRRGHVIVAGLALGSLCFKPHWVAVAGAIFVFARAWRVVAGIVVAITVQYAVTWMIVGFDVMHAYWRTLLSLPKISHLLEPRPTNTFRGFFETVVPHEPTTALLYVLAALTTLVAAGKFWNSDARFELRASGVVLTMVLVSPHAFQYDLILLAPALLLLTNWLAESPDAAAVRPIVRLLPIVFFAPVLGSFPIGVPVTVALMTALLVAVVMTTGPRHTGLLSPLATAFVSVRERGALRRAHSTTPSPQTPPPNW